MHIDEKVVVLLYLSGMLLDCLTVLVVWEWLQQSMMLLACGIGDNQTIILPYSMQ